MSPWHTEMVIEETRNTYTVLVVTPHGDSRGASVSIVTSGVRLPRGAGKGLLYSPSLPNQFWSPPSLLYNV
jgi:hypothetical protein